MKFSIITMMVSAFIICTNQHIDVSTTTPSKNVSSTQIQKVKQTSLLDTTIVISNRNTSVYKLETLTGNDAENILYNHFKNKGILSRKEWLTRSTIYSGQTCVDYDTIYCVQAKNLSGAVISYWSGPMDLNGHCFQPNKATILYTPKGYKFKNENFIPSSFTIDSTKGNMIYGYQYECGGKGYLRPFRITLK